MYEVRRSFTSIMQYLCKWVTWARSFARLIRMKLAAMMETLSCSRFRPSSFVDPWHPKDTTVGTKSVSINTTVVFFSLLAPQIWSLRYYLAFWVCLRLFGPVKNGAASTSWIFLDPADSCMEKDPRRLHSLFPQVVSYIFLAISRPCPSHQNFTICFACFTGWGQML